MFDSLSLSDESSWDIQDSIEPSRSTVDHLSSSVGRLEDQPRRRTESDRRSRTDRFDSKVGPIRSNKVDRQRDENSFHARRISADFVRAERQDLFGQRFDPIRANWFPFDSGRFSRPEFRSIENLQFEVRKRRFFRSRSFVCRIDVKSLVFVTDQIDDPTDPESTVQPVRRVSFDPSAWKQTKIILSALIQQPNKLFCKIDVHPVDSVSLIDHFEFFVDDLPQNIVLSSNDLRFSAEGFAGGEQYEIYLLAHPLDTRLQAQMSNKRVTTIDSTRLIVDHCLLRPSKSDEIFRPVVLL